MGQPDAPIAGPQGNQPQFLVECAFSHAAQDDPIVFPDQPGMSHLHVFFGNTVVDQIQFGLYSVREFAVLGNKVFSYLLTF